MELKLNVYDDNDVVVKTYVTQSFRIKLGLLKDFANLLDENTIKMLLKGASEDSESVINTFSNLLSNAKDLVYNLLKQLFKGLTDEELDNCYIDDLLSVVKGLTVFTVKSIGLANKKQEKN